MKRTILTVAAALMMATCVIAQDIPAGMRMELIESEDDSRDQYTIFKYKEKNGNEAYYMGVGNKIELLGLVRDDITDMSISHMDEVCLPMGSTRQEVIDNLDSYLELLGKPAGTTVEFPCRINNGVGLGDESKSTCIDQALPAGQAALFPLYQRQPHRRGRPSQIIPQIDEAKRKTGYQTASQ